MKTLYININGENIQSTEDIIVVGRPGDAIINKFFFELGKEILKGVVAPGVTNIKKKDIVTEFKTHDEKSYNLIMEQWDTLKQELLGKKPSGTRSVKLPDEYISWLQNSSQPVYAEIAKSLYKRGCSVEINLDKIYKNAIGIIVNNIEPEECKDCGQFVVNDDAVTDDSAITGSIQERMPQIAFVPFEDFGKCPECGKMPCECKQEPPVCPKCGMNPCECANDPLFPIDDINLGETNIKDLIKDENVDITPNPNKEHDNVLFSKGLITFYNGYYEVYISQTGFKYIQFYGSDSFSHLVANSFGKFPQSWTEYFGFSISTSLQDVKNVLATKRIDEQNCFRIPENQNSHYKYMITFYTEHKKYFVSLFFGVNHVKGGLFLYDMIIEKVTCPYCKSKDVRYSINLNNEIEMNLHPCINHQCDNCNRRWINYDLSTRCFSCGSYGTMVRTKKNRFKCIVCGYSF